VVRLIPAIAAWATDPWVPFVSEIEALVQALSPDEREVVRRFLESTAEAAERHADRLVRDARLTSRSSST
jgi:hypothetical protein